MKQMNFKSPAQVFIRRALQAVLPFFFMLFPLTSQAMAEIEIGSKISQAEKHILRISVPDNRVDHKLEIEWVKVINGSIYLFSHTHKSRTGEHAYEMRGVPQWTGNIALVNIANINAKDGISGKVIRPSLKDEIDIFLEPQSMDIYPAHFLRPYRLLGLSWNAWLGTAFLLGTLFFAIRLKNISRALLGGLTLAFALTDIHAMMTHAKLIHKAETSHFWILKSFGKIDQALQPAPDKIKDASWTIDNSWTTKYDVVKPFVGYRLAEKRFIPPENKNEADYLITIKNRIFDILKARR